MVTVATLMSPLSFTIIFLLPLIKVTFPNIINMGKKQFCKPK